MSEINTDYFARYTTTGINGMTSEYFDLDDVIVYAPETEQQEVTNQNVPQKYTKVFDNKFSDIEIVEASKGPPDSHDETLWYENNQNEANHVEGIQPTEDESSKFNVESPIPETRKDEKRKYDTENRKINTAEWMVNKRKFKRNSGQEYIGRGGKPVAAKEFINKPCNCRFQCDQKFTEHERKLLFDTFWDLQDYSLQNISLHGMVEVVEVERHRDASLVRPRFKTFKYFLQPNANSDPLRVCKRYFLDTFQISHGRMYRCCSKPDLEEAVDHRGQPSDDKEQRRLQKTHVKEHIEQYAIYKQQFLSSSLAIRNMYDLYVKECEEQKQLPLSQKYYYQVMDTILSVRVVEDSQKQQRRRKKVLLKRLYSRHELVRMIGTILRLRERKQQQRSST